MSASRFGPNRRFLAPRDSRDSRFEQPWPGMLARGRRVLRERACPRTRTSQRGLPLPHGRARAPCAVPAEGALAVPSLARYAAVLRS